MQSVTSNAVANALGYLVWENPDSSQDFAGQTITFDKAIPYGYSKILVEARHWSNSSLRFLTLVNKEYAGFLSTIWSDSSGNFNTLTRRVEVTSDSACTFGDCRSTLNYNTPSVTNWGAVPTRIWAIK